MAENLGGQGLDFFLLPKMDSGDLPLLPELRCPESVGLGGLQGAGASLEFALAVLCHPCP